VNHFVALFSQYFLVLVLKCLGAADVFATKVRTEKKGEKETQMERNLYQSQN
jgi:hypothetical protein